jgi:hypothetical protein
MPHGQFEQRLGHFGHQLAISNQAIRNQPERLCVRFSHVIRKNRALTHSG